MRRMKRRTWLRAMPLSVLLPAGIADAMERAFIQAPIGSPNAEEKRQGDAMTGSAKVYELRIYHVVPESWTARATMVVRTVCRSRVEPTD